MSEIKKIVVGNWKMYKNNSETSNFIDELAGLSESFSNVLLAVPFTAIDSAVQAASMTDITIGAQNINEHPFGAYTGEISAAMIKDAGARFVIVGHSERRLYFQETNAMVGAKVKAALSEGLQPLLCIGETLEQRNQELTESILEEQIKSALQGLSLDEALNVIIAYEPIWAIGSGLAADVKTISQVHRFCRHQASLLYGEESLRKFKVLYGGSVNSKNADELFESDDVDGVLVGSASLGVDSFSRIVNSRNHCKSSIK